MAEARLRYGTQSSADVKLFLTGSDDKQYERNPVYLHSQILSRLKSFEGKFSNRHSSDRSTKIRVTTSHNFDHYLKCIEIMYGEPVGFPNVEECLAILSVASDLLGEECINKCMQYLEAVRWSAEEESQIQEVLSSEGLKLKITPDLATRLHQGEDDEHINFVEKSIREMVSLIKGSGSSKSRETVEKDLAGILDDNASRDVVDVCGRVLLQEFEASIDSRDIPALTQLFKLIQHCHGEILEAAFKALCEDAKFMECFKSNSCAPQIGVASVFEVVVWFMRAVADGKIIISRASRVSFLATWLPIMGSLGSLGSLHGSLRRRYVPVINKSDEKFEELDNAVLKVVESLPQVDQKRICLLWAEVYRSRGIDIATPFTLSKSLQLAAHSKSAAK